MEQRQSWIAQGIRLNALYILIISNEFAEDLFPVYLYNEAELEPMKAQYENASFDHIEEIINVIEEKEKKEA
jgi:hypothetical protein